MASYLLDTNVRRHMLTHLRQTNVELTGQALTDPLTGIANRRGLDDVLGRVLARSRRDGTSVQLAFIDLDGFKAINDRLGHEAGDRFLQEVARRLAAGTRAAEFVGRYGGDEFVLVTEDANPDRLRARLDGVIRGRYELGTTALDYPGASIGVVTGQPGESAEALLKRADASMYATKRSRKAEASARASIAP